MADAGIAAGSIRGNAGGSGRLSGAILAGVEARELGV